MTRREVRARERAAMAARRQTVGANPALALALALAIAPAVITTTASRLDWQHATLNAAVAAAATTSAVHLTWTLTQLLTILT